MTVKLLVYGAGALGSLFAARLHEAGHEVSLLARGARLASVRAHGVRLAQEGRAEVRSVPVRVVDEPGGGYDLTVVIVRAHQVGPVLDSLVDTGGDVALLANWAAGPGPLVKALGPERVLLGFPAAGGRVVDDVLRHRAETPLTRLVTMPVGEPDGRVTPRLKEVVRVFRGAGLPARAEPGVDAWLTTHASFVAPLGQAVDAAGGPAELAGDRDAVLALARRIKANLTAAPTPVAPLGYRALRAMPDGLVAAGLRRFLRGTIAELGLAPTAAATAENALLVEQLRERAG
ncbi:ketopantoate reductase family protein [Actinosynnema sp.]|uniref:ketopantoate reductase family protein n=1 Tax=Actinosynnema sp. TaxID=1872144 RepID=UPI003F850390